MIFKFNAWSLWDSLQTLSLKSVARVIQNFFSFYAILTLLYPLVCTSSMNTACAWLMSLQNSLKFPNSGVVIWLFNWVAQSEPINETLLQCSRIGDRDQASRTSVTKPNTSVFFNCIHNTLYQIWCLIY